MQFPHSGKFSTDFLTNLGNWDGGHFLGIAKNGYSQNFQYAFFPLYPLLIRFLSLVTNNYLLSAILISGGSFFLGLHFLYGLVNKLFDKKIAEKTILALLFFPTSFFFLTAYSEGLFFLLAVLTFSFWQNKKFGWATIFAALASATRLVGIIVAISLIVEVLITGVNRKNWVVLLSPIGLVIYCVYLFHQTGDPFYFFTAEQHWQRALTIPGLSFWDSIKSLTSSGVNIDFNVLLDLLFAIFGLGFAIRSFRFLPGFLSIYSLGTLLIPLLTTSLISMPRFILPVFPIFILLAQIKNEKINFFYQMISLMLLSAFTILFTNGYWVS